MDSLINVCEDDHFYTSLQEAAEEYGSIPLVPDLLKCIMLHFGEASDKYHSLKLFWNMLLVVEC